MTDSYIIPSVLLGAGFIQGIILFFVFLFFKKGHRKPNLIFAILLLGITLIIFQNFFIFIGWHSYIPHLIWVFVPFNGIFGALFYFYVVFLINPDRKFKVYDILHLLPALYLLVSMWPFYNLSARQKIDAVEYYLEGAPLVSFPKIAIVQAVIVFGYSIAACHLLIKLKRDLKAMLSKISFGYMGWLSIFTFVFVLFNGIRILVLFLVVPLAIRISTLEIIIHIMNTIFIYYVAIVAIIHSDRLFYKLLIHESSGLKNYASASDRGITSAQLTDFMKEHKPYLNPDLKIHNLADMLSVSPYSLSTLINQEFGTNFYNFINKYRVLEFKDRIQSNIHIKYTLLAIAYEVGFNSKASFNRIFKNHTGVSPRQYISKEVSSSGTETTAR